MTETKLVARRRGFQSSRVQPTNPAPARVSVGDVDRTCGTRPGRHGVDFGYWLIDSQNTGRSEVVQLAIGLLRRAGQAQRRDTGRRLRRRRRAPRLFAWTQRGCHQFACAQIALEIANCQQRHRPAGASRGAADVREQHHIVQIEQRLRHPGFVGEHV